jgi:hypothetical protein
MNIGENCRWEFRVITTNGVPKSHWLWYCQEHWEVDPVAGGIISEKQPESPPYWGCDACECVIWEQSLRANARAPRLGVSQVFLTEDHA